MEGSPPEYDLYLVTYKLVEHKQSRTSFVPLLAELTGGQRLEINPRTARARGIADGQAFVVESHNAVTGETRRVTVRSRYTEAIRPDVVAMPHGFGLWIHPWARGQGPSPNVLYSAVAAAYRGAGYLVEGSEVPDHLAVELDFLGELCRREAEGGPAAEGWRERELSFLRGHLLRWLPRFVERLVRASPAGFYRWPAEAALALARHDEVLLASLGAGRGVA